MGQDDDTGVSRHLRLMARIVDGILVALLAFMIGLAALQILMRNLFHSGFVTGEPLLRSLVLWVGMLGAIVASRTDKHISIDVLTRLLPSKAKAAVRVVIDLFVSVVCVLLAYHAGRLVASDYEAGTLAFANVPAWMVELILPFAFGVIALRYIFLCVAAVNRFIAYTRRA